MSLDMQSWDWTCDHLIGRVCEYLELHLMEGFSGAIVLLLGQLGRYCPTKSYAYYVCSKTMFTALSGTVSILLIMSQ